ncbi:hypothetical protein evm_013838 [Chilo suppressalis]|nr:hypothetical protein evm_013838 [Chilo suppressalis]
MSNFVRKLEQQRHKLGTLVNVNIVLHCLFLNRVGEEVLDDLSCTDLEQQWGSIKATHYKTYEAKRLCDLCHVKCQSRPTVQVTEVMKARWRDERNTSTICTSK